VVPTLPGLRLLSCKAEQLGWSTSHLRREVRVSLRERAHGVEATGAGELAGPCDGGEPGSDRGRPDPASAGRPGGEATMVQVRLTREQSQLCERAASALPCPPGLPAPRTAPPAATP
jgi:hypothetical protein